MKKHAKKIITALLVIAMLVPTIAMIYSSAVTTFTVELAFDNLFVFDHWVTNGNSMIIDNDAGATGTVGEITEISLEDGSFKFSNFTDHYIYTRAAAEQGETVSQNFDYYYMPVEENTTYNMTFNITGTNPAFYPFVFFYDETNEFESLVYGGPFTGEGDFSYQFTVPSGIKYIQIRLRLDGNAEKNASVVVKDISISKYKFELDTNNLFSLDSWVASDKSDQPASSLVAYNDGTITPKDSDSDGSYDQIYFETDLNGDSGKLFSDFDYTSNEGYYSMDVDPSTTYTLSYNISGGTALHFKPYICRYKSDGTFIDFIGEAATAYGVTNYTFTTTSETEYIAVVFSIEHGNTSWNLTLQDIGIYKTYITDYTVDPVRKTYSYSSDSTATYGELPTPPAETYPENYIFAGWYTEKDGKGTRITADTEIIPQSMTVYPKFEPAVDSLAVKTPPAKTTYTVGEKINTAGLVLTYGIVAQENIYDSEGNVTGTQEVTTTTDISSGFYIDPEYASSTAGTQTITAHYGGKTATFTITVSDGDDKNIVVNGATQAVKVANNNYTINYEATEAFNRYEMTYFSDSYVKGEIVMDDATEEFFLEPSNNGTFASYIDNFLSHATHSSIVSIKFTCLDKEFGSFELLTLTTIASTVPSNATQYYESTETGYKVGVDLSFGGVVSEIYDLNNVVESRVYTIDGKDVTKVDYAERLDADYGTDYISRSTENVNLINKYDRGRYLQQSYYGTSQKPYKLGNYNGQDWPYNPVQGGNLIVNNADGTVKGNEASKVIDYRITSDQIYVKTRPLDWGKNSVDYPDSYVTDSYMEAWYVFEDGMIKTYCRFVDYSGYPSHTRAQELPAVYIIEPLNHFVYNNVEDGSEWTTNITDTFVKIEEPEFWGVKASYNAVLTANNLPTVDPTVDCYENWAAFTASDNEESFGVGVYSAGVTDFHYGCFYAKYQEDAAENGELKETENRHAFTPDPATENPTSYISPVDSMTFESYSPIEYSYYLTTGTAEEIYTDFKNIATEESQAELDKAKIAVPETVYMTPASGASKSGQYYVNNILNADNYYNVETKTEYTDMYLGVYAKDATYISVDVSNVTNPDDDINVCNLEGTVPYDGTIFSFADDGTDDSTFIFSAGLDMDFETIGLEPGEKATAKWEIVVYYGTKEEAEAKTCEYETYTAYTVMYAPHRTVGAVSEMRQNSDSNNEISSWITGANGIDHSTRAPLGSLKSDYRNSGYFKTDPLVDLKTLPTGGSYNTSYDYILGYGTENGSDDDNNNNAYVMQTATNDHDSSRAQSYLGLLTVDKSRYTNTDQIPNLRVGYDVLRVGSATSNSVGKYTTYYTLGTESSFTATTDYSAAPSGWTTFTGEYTDFADSHDIPYRESFVPSFDVSTIDGKYIHAINHSKGDSIWSTNQYSMAGTSVLCSLTDKSALRDTVLEGYTMPAEDYTDATYEEFLEKLEDAATVLGDPSATQDEIDNANKELENVIDELVTALYALKYDNLFSAYEFSQHSGNMTMSHANASVYYENGVITTVTNEVITDMTDPEAYTSYASSTDFYLIDLKPDTEYVFEYDVTTTANAQAFMFFYNSNGELNATNKPTNIYKKINSDTWSGPSAEGNAWWGNYNYGANTYHCVIKFTTGPDVAKAGFRFGNVKGEIATSSFSNIKLINSARYYEDVVYEKTEAHYEQYQSYGTLPTLTRNGYTFGGWQYADGTTVTGADYAEDHVSIFSVWEAVSYTITYNANGGSVSPAAQTYTVTDSVTLPAPTRSGYTFANWKVTTADGSWVADTAYDAGTVLTGMYGNVTLTAQWGLNEFLAYFDTILDFDEWNTTSANDATISNVTSNGFTLTSNSGVGEGKSTSPEFPVTAGTQYKIDIDITGSSWDVYIFFRDSSGNWLHSDGPDCRYSSTYFTGMHEDHVFTAPENAVKAAIRVDANGASNTVTFSDIRVYEADTRAANVNVPDSSYEVEYGGSFGTLPVPTREGYEFLGWFDEDGNQVTDNQTVAYTSAVYLKSKWAITNDALVKDTVVIDFSTPIEITPLANDTVYANAEASSFLGISSDGVTPAESVTGTYGTFTVSDETVTYKPAKAVDSVETIYYHASITDENGTHSIKNEITVAPASNVLYEETFFTAASADNRLAWTADDDAALNVNQDSSTANDVYGYDSNTSGYNQSADYSNGTAFKINVSNTNRISQNLSFTFSGKGFDLNSACGANTGVMIVSVRKNNADNTTTMVKSYIVDTYYGDTYNTLYQVPVVCHRDLSYGSYTVQVAASYLPSMSGAVNASEAVETAAVENVDGMTAYTAPVADNEALRAALAEIGMEYVLDAESVEVVWFDDDSVLNGGKGANTPAEDVVETAALESLLNVVDSVRVYHPLDEDDSHYIESEKNAVYYNVIDNLVNGDGTFSTGDEGIVAYVSGNANISILDNYEKYGPKDELYLSESTTNAVAFNIANYADVKDSIKVMISLRAASGTPTAKFGEYQFDVKSNTEMYYDITDYISADGTVTIQNVPDADTNKTLLSVGTIKITSADVETASLSADVDLATVRTMMLASATDVEPNAPEVTEEPETPDNSADNTEESENEFWLIRIFKWVVESVKKVIGILKDFLTA